MPCRCCDDATPRPGIDRPELCPLGEQTQGILHDNNRSVDDQPEVERAQAHEIARNAQGKHAGAGDEEGQRDHARHDQRRAPIAHDDQENDRHEQRALPQVALDRRDRTIDQVGTRILHADNHAFRQRRLRFRQPGIDAAGDLPAILADQHHRRAEHGLTPVRRRRTLTRCMSHLDGSKIADRQRLHTTRELDGQGADHGGVGHPQIGTHGQLFGAAINHAATSILRGKPDPVGKLGHGDTGGIEARDIGLDQILRFVAAIGVDFGDTLDLPKHRAHNILLGLVELHQLVLLVHAHRRMRPFERVIIDFAQTGGDRRKLRRGSHRQLATHRRQSFGDKLPRLQLVGAILVDEGDLTQPGLGERPRLVEPRLPRHGALDRQGDLMLDLVRRERGHGGIDLHLHAGDVGNGIDRQVDERINACRDDQHRQEQDDAQAIGRPGEEPLGHSGLPSSGWPPLSARS